MAYHGMLPKYLRGGEAGVLIPPLEGSSSSPRWLLLKEEEDNNDDGDVQITITQQPIAFQLTMSVILGIIVMAQIALLVAFIIHRSKRVLEFAQPLVICVFIICGVIITCTCYLFLYMSNIGCAIREPILFVASSIMGSTIAGRAWRISTLMSNPLMSMGTSTRNMGEGGSDDKPPPVEMARLFVLQGLSALSGCNFFPKLGNIYGRSTTISAGRPIRVQVSFGQMILATTILVLPQLLLQITILAVPALRAAMQISYSENYGTTIGQYTCQSSSRVGLYANYILSSLFSILPYCCAYLLNLRPKAELDQLPEVIDERDQLKSAFAIFVQAIAVTGPIVGLSIDPSVRAYATICGVLGLSLSLSYHIAYQKIASLQSNITQQKQARHKQSLRASLTYSGHFSGDGEKQNEGHSAALAVRMAEMYEKFGRGEETIQLVDETLEAWKKDKNTNHAMNAIATIGQKEARREEIGSGFTKNDLKNLQPHDIELIIQLLRLKGKALMKLHGQDGFAMSANLNIVALKIFENSPAAAKMKDISTIFPVYNLVGLQLRGGVIHQDDECTLEMDLATRYCHEAQVQSYHYARALINLADVYGRIGLVDEAFKYFDIMKTVYMPNHHPQLLVEAYAVDRCAIGFATSALWHLQKGEIGKAIEGCDHVIKEILPNYDKKDFIGLFHLLVPIVRVLKWNGLVDKARKAYNDNVSEGVETHFAVGSIHRPMSLLLRICDGSSEQYNTEEADIEMALAFDTDDMSDNVFTCECWSMKSLAAELCFHLARRLEPGNPARESLVDRGIQMSTIANKRVKAANGMIRHILAYEAQKEIHAKLLKLAQEDNATSRSVIYERSPHRHLIDQMDSSSTTSHATTGSSRTSAPDFARRLVVKTDQLCQNQTKTESMNGSIPEFSKTKSLSSKPSQVHLHGERHKRVSFSSDFDNSNVSTSLPPLEEEAPHQTSLKRALAVNRAA